jgi:hypothetical protein
MVDVYSYDLTIATNAKVYDFNAKYVDVCMICV